MAPQTTSSSCISSSPLIYFINSVFRSVVKPRNVFILPVSILICLTIFYAVISIPERMDWKPRTIPRAILSVDQSVFVSPTGRLGNCLFQFAAGYALSRRVNGTLTLCKDTGIPFKDLDAFAIRAPRRYCGLKKISKNYYKGVKLMSEKELFYLNGTIPSDTYIQLSGYFQSEEYFKDYKDEILQQLVMNTSFHSRPSVELLADEVDRSTSVAVHVRRGDFVRSNPYLTLPIEYQIRAMRLILKSVQDPTFYIFSDDIPYVKKAISNETDFETRKVKVVFVTGNSTKTNIEDLYIMSLCKYFIMANSTFSWWGAYLSKAIQVVAPKPHFHPEFFKKYKDLKVREWKQFLYGNWNYPSHWTTINPFVE